MMIVIDKKKRFSRDTRMSIENHHTGCEWFFPLQDKSVH